MDTPRRIVTNWNEHSSDLFDPVSFPGDDDDSDDSENEDSKLKKCINKISDLEDSYKVISNDLNKTTIDETKKNTIKQNLDSILNELNTINFPKLRSLLGGLENRINNTKKELQVLYEKNNKIPEIVENFVKNMTATPEKEKKNEETTLENLILQHSELRDMINNVSQIPAPKISRSVAINQGNGKYFCDIPFSTEYLRTSQKHKQSLQSTGVNTATEIYSDPSLSEPVPLVLKVAGGKFALNDEPIRRIVYRDDVINKKIVVISVTGLPRCGKSCLLKLIYRFLASKEAEDWAASEDDNLLKDLQACECSESNTKGILIWPLPVIINDLAVILLDSQGTISDENEASFHETTFISALSTMLSSIQICNVADVSHMDQLAHVKVFLEYGRLVMQEYGVKAFQKLTFLVRDWCSPLTSYGMGGGQTFLNDWMKERGSTSHTEYIFDMMSCFDTTSCFLLPHPAHGHKVASEGFNGNIGDLDPMFKQVMTNFVETIFSRKNLVTKRIGREEIQATDLLPYVRMCVNELQKSDLQAQSIFEGSAGLKLIKFVLDSLKYYEQKMEELMPVTEDIDALHRIIEEEAVQMYNSVRKFGGETVTTRYREALLKEIAERYNKGVKKFKEDREIAREELREEKMRSAKRTHKRKIDSFLESKDFDTSFSEKHNSLRAKAITYFITEVAGQITEEQQDTCIKKLDKRLQEYYKSHLDEYNKQRTTAKAKQRDEDCNIITNNAITNYLKTIHAVQIKENISEAHINAKNKAFDEILALKKKYKDHNIQPYIETLNHEIDSKFENCKIEHERKMSAAECEANAELRSQSILACEKYSQLMEFCSNQNSNLAEILEMHETSLKIIDSDFFKPLIAKFGPEKCKSCIKKTKKKIKKTFKELKAREVENWRAAEHEVIEASALPGTSKTARSFFKL